MCNSGRSPQMQHTSPHMVSAIASITQAACVKSLPSQISNEPPLILLLNPSLNPLTNTYVSQGISRKGTRVKPKKGLSPQNIPAVQAMFSLPQQIYTVVSDGPGFLLKRSLPIINSMAADTARHLHGSLTLQDCSQGLGACGCGLKDGGSGGHEGLQTGWWCQCVCVCVCVGWGERGW